MSTQEIPLLVREIDKLVAKKRTELKEKGYQEKEVASFLSGAVSYTLMQHVGAMLNALSPKEYASFESVLKKKSFDVESVYSVFSVLQIPTGHEAVFLQKLEENLNIETEE
jgi:hypothetical protein